MRPPQYAGWTIDAEIAFIDGLAREKDTVALRGYVRSMAVRHWDFVTDRNGTRRPLNEGVRGQCRGRAMVHLNDLLGR